MENESTDILITGGAGFIGTHTIEQLRGPGRSISVIDNYFAGEPDMVPESVETYEVDIRNDKVVDLVEEIDPNVVVHLAAIHYIPYCNENPGKAWEVNVYGTRNVFKGSSQCPNLKRVVFASSAAVYPPRASANAENSERRPIDVYGRTKLLGEDLAQLFQQDTGVPVSVARLFNVYGPRETNMHLIPAILDQIRDGSRTVELGNLSPARDFVFVEDVADALARMAENADSGFRSYNVGTGREHSVRSVVEYVEDALGEELAIAQDESRVRESDRPSLKADIERIKSELNWMPETGFEEGLTRLLESEDIL